jgi:hypothetical protein
MSQGGKHSHTIRRLRRRLGDAVERERERRKPPPPPISPEHAAMRDRIERAIGAVHQQVPEGMDFEDALMENYELATSGAHIMALMREEQDFLADQGVDPRPYARYEPKF